MDEENEAGRPAGGADGAGCGATEPEALRLAIEDARARSQALLDLVLFSDQQMMTLFAAYVAGGVAAAAGAIAGLAIGGAAAWGFAGALFVAAAALAWGADLCLRSMRGAPVGLPARGADFWLWAIDHDAPSREVAGAYLRALQKTDAENKAVNDLQFRFSKQAKLLGRAAPVLAVAGGLLAAMAAASI